MFKSFQDTSALQQFHGFPNLNMQQATSAYGFGGVTFWLDAAYGLDTQTNLGAVSRWQARVGGAIFEQTTAASQPRLILTDANYNNLPSVEAQSSARFMTSALGLKFNPNITVAVVSKVNTNNNVNVILGVAATSNLHISDGGLNTGLNGFGLYNSSAGLLIGNTETTTARIKIVSTNNVIVNGTIENTGTLNQNVELTQLFRFGTNPLNNMIGTISEIIAFGYAMTSDEAIALSNNINQKYAIY
jgi:hypothetical protein